MELDGIISIGMDNVADKVLFYPFAIDGYARILQAILRMP